MPNPLFNIRTRTETGKLLDPNRIRRGFAKALTASARVGRQVYMRASEFVRRRDSTIRPARRRTLRAELNIEDRKLTIYEAAGQVQQTPSGVMADPYEKVQLFGGAFVATMPDGHIGVFRRARASEVPTPKARSPHRRVGRLPIRELWGPSVVEKLRLNEVDEQAEARMRDAIHARLRRQVATDLGRR